MGRPKKIVNNTNIPQHEIDAIARCLLPYMLQALDDEECIKEFTNWKAEQAQAQTPQKATTKNLL